jgi:predicted NUDIX family phosphoesterase
MTLDGSEHVLVVPREALDALGRFRGFRAVPRPEQGELLDDLLEHAHFLPRSEELEHGERGLAFAQLVAYGILVRRGRVFVFRRPAKDGDGWRSSVGLGGHVNAGDVARGNRASRPEWPRCSPDCLARCMSRALREDVTVRGLSLHLAGLLRDDANDVGRRHVGVVFRCEVGGELVTSNRAAVEPVGWRAARELAECPAAPIGEDRWQDWSRLVIERLSDVVSGQPSASSARA